MKKSLVFLFDINCDNREAYAKALSLANAEDSELLMLTTYSATEYLEKQDEIYFHLLDLFGYYQTNYANWSNKLSVKTSRNIIPDGAIQHIFSLIKEETIQTIAMLKDSPKANSIRNYKKFFLQQNIRLYLL